MLFEDDSSLFSVIKNNSIWYWLGYWLKKDKWMGVSVENELCPRSNQTGSKVNLFS